MAKLDDNYYYLKNQRSSNEQKQRSVQNEINQAESKIKRLKTAYNEIDDVKEYLKSQRKSLGKLPKSYESSWKGAHANSTFTSCFNGGELNRNYKSYIDSVDAAQDAINNEICRLKNVKAAKYGILQGLISTWNNLTTQIQNYFN